MTTQAPIDRLTALDRLMVTASRRWPQVIGALAILDEAPLLDSAGDLRIDAVRAAIASRLPLVPRLRQVIHAPRRGLGGPLWIDAPRFDIRDHVVARQLPSGIDEAGLTAMIEELSRARFDPSKPLWCLWLLSGLTDGRVAMFVGMHHAIADGMAAMRTVTALLEAGPDEPAPAWTPSPPPSDRELFTDGARRRLRTLRRAGSAVIRPAATLRRARQTWPALRELLTEKPSTRTSLDQMVGSGRRLAFLRTPLGDVKSVAQAYGATVNDLLLAATAGGLRAVLRGRGEPIEDTVVRAYVPVSLRHTGSPTQGNLIAQMALPLAMLDSEGGNELRRIAAETRTRKARARPSLATLIGGRLTRRLLLVAVMRQRVNVTTASIRGPAAPLYLCGSRVLEAFPVLPLVADEALGVAGLSYAGGFTVGVVADRDAYPDLGVFMAGARAELESVGVPAHAAPVRKEMES